MRLSQKQLAALQRMAQPAAGIAGSDEHDYRSLGGIQVARSLNRKGLCRLVSGHPPPRYSITRAGREALAQAVEMWLPAPPQEGGS